MPRSPVLLVLLLLGLAGASGFAFLSHAPNRLLSGVPISLLAALNGGFWLLAVPASVLLAASFLPPRRATHIAVALAASLLSVGLIWLAGSAATALAATAPPAARSSLGAGFWLMLAASGLSTAEALRRLGLSPAGKLLVIVAIAAALAVLLASGSLADLSILREYANRRDVFAMALWRHITLVLAALAIALPIGVLLGLLAQRRPAWRGPVFAVLGVVQTIPSIALFGLLMAPLTRLGVGGVGVAPAITALALYALLPIARNVTAGLDGVPAAVRDAARGMGMTGGEIFRLVDIPLALPALLTGLRITLVQAIGLAAVAALIGAGGLGAIMFQGLFANALDLVLLGVLPIVALAAGADAVMRLIVSLIDRRAA